MKKYYLLMFSILLVVLFYAIPAYSGNGLPGCCQGIGRCRDQADSTGCDGDFHEGWTCVVDTCVEPTPSPTPALGCCNILDGVRVERVQCIDQVSPVECEGEGPFVEGGICDNNGECNLPVNPDHLMCYDVKDPLVIPTGKGVTETTFFVSVPQFGSEARCTLKGRTREFCAPACKDNLRGDPPAGAGLCQPDPENPLGFDRICYKIENCVNISGQINDLEVGATDQFDEINIAGEGPRLLTNFNPQRLCTPALKCHPGCPIETFEIEDPCDTNQIRDNEYCDMNCQCILPVCDNGIIEPGEECDTSGNRGITDQCPIPPYADGYKFCNDSCECVLPVCGNGVKESNEECDTGESGPSDDCSPGEICSIRNNCTCINPR